MQANVPSSEFLRWKDYRNTELNSLDKITSYLKLIAAEVRRTNVKDPRSVRLDDFNLEFKSVRKAPTENLGDDDNPPVDYSKQIWHGIFAAWSNKGGKSQNGRTSNR